MNVNESVLRAVCKAVYRAVDRAVDRAVYRAVYRALGWDGDNAVVMAVDNRVRYALHEEVGNE
jgi:Arc/MetJ family transcription regulator